MVEFSRELTRLEHEANWNHQLTLRIDDFRVRVVCNSERLHEALAKYFRHWTEAHPTSESTPIRTLYAYDGEPLEFGLDFTLWGREPGKTGKKEEFVDVERGRIIRKVRTGMQFFASPDRLWALGPCTENANQVINFVNAQFINFQLHRGAVLCHSAAVLKNGFGLAISAHAGGGKSTLCLELVRRGWTFVTNDRLLAFGKTEDKAAHMVGVPKYPRTNPGTLLNNPALKQVLPKERQLALAEMDVRELWHLEEKYDVDVHELFGPDAWQLSAPMSAFLVLSWKQGSTEETRIEQRDLQSAEALLGPIAKSSGPFYLGPDGESLPGYAPPPLAPYRRALAEVQLFEATGKPDFALAAKWLEERCGNP